jgi:predicted O-linked N-acetylglucosamine transferase (SPINDLY family)
MAAATMAEVLTRAQRSRADGNLTQAEQLCRQVVQAAPRDAEAWCLLADLCKSQDRLDEAVTNYRHALQFQPELPRAHNSLGILYAQRKQFPEAEASFRRAVKLQRDYSKAFNNLGNVLCEQGKLAEAAQAYQQAHQLGYRDPALHDNLAQVYLRLGDARAAEVQLQKALRAKPDDAELLKRLGVVLTTLAQFDAAIACFRRLMRTRSDDADSWWRLGEAFTGHGLLDKAIAALREAIRLSPAAANYHHHLGATLMQLGELNQAQACLRHALQLDPNDSRIRTSLLFCRCYDPGAPAAEVFADHRLWGELHAPPIAKPTHPNVPDSERLLRIGYVSPDFRGHPVGRFIEPALAQFDSARFQVFCYDEFVRPADPLTQRLQSRVRNWRNVRGMSDEQLAAQIRADQIDVLVDLAGHTASNRLLTFALKPAPIQVTYLGYPHTTGVSAIDYVISDAVADPLDQAAWFTEEVIRLPNGFCCFTPRDDVPSVGPLPARRNGFLTFGSLHGQSKLNEPVLNLWAEILRAAPAAKLLFARHTMAGDGRDRLLRLLAERGIDENRLIFRQLNAGTGEYWNVYNDIDISLDPFPWTGHTTATESLWMGVPVISLRGVTHAGRMVASVLTFAGMTDWIAETPQSYLELASRWTTDLDGLSRLRSGMRDQLRRARLCDMTGYGRQLEHAYRGMWRRWCAGQKPGLEPLSAKPASQPKPRDENLAIERLAKAEQFRQAGDWAEAERRYRLLLDTDPAHVEGWTLFGDACKGLGQWSDAANHYRKALDLRPQVPRTWNSLGIVLARQRRFAEAERAFRHVVELDPDHAKGWNNLGNVLSELSRSEEAVAAYRQAHRLGYDDTSLHENLGNLLLRSGDYAEAERHYTLALRRKPDDSVMLRRLAEVLVKRNQFGAAADLLRRVLRLRPDDADLHWRLGDALTGDGNLTQAAQCYREAVKLQPNNPAFLHHLGTALMMAGRITEATRQYRQAMGVMANNRLSHASLLFVMSYDPDLAPEEVFAEHRRWGELYAALPKATPVFPNARHPERRLRVGYVSPDFRAHPVGRFIEPVLRNHDANRFEVFCYDEFLRPPDPLTARLQAHVRHWRNTRHRSDDDVAAQVRADGIDILVDLAGHTGSNRLGLFARKPAPIQMTWLGYPNTTGVPAIDYLITDGVADPPAEPVLFTEQPLRLPHGFCAFAPRDNTPPVSPAPALRNGHVTFGALHNQAKLNRRVLALWAQVLNAVPTSKLLIARHTLTDDARADILGQFAALGIAENRMLIRRLKAGAGDHWSAYHNIDISLDPFPWTGHTTSCESLWMGVPVITLRGKAHAGRMVASVLSFAGLPEWIAETSDQYIELAQQWAGRFDALVKLRATMREQLRSSKLYDVIGFTRGLEEAYRRAWLRWCSI